mmetsp:Transcript_17794/g.30229  ORF Transcript_17794/g.30229 Transcript_17794/m.30229 type:complete len:207 (-) Transcript_17794:450-1070(-)
MSMKQVIAWYSLDKFIIRCEFIQANGTFGGIVGCCCYAVLVSNWSHLGLRQGVVVVVVVGCNPIDPFQDSLSLFIVVIIVVVVVVVVFVIFLKNGLSVFFPQLFVGHPGALEPAVSFPVSETIVAMGGQPGRNNTPFSCVEFGCQPCFVGQWSQILWLNPNAVQFQQSFRQQRFVEPSTCAGIQITPHLILILPEFLSQSINTGVL